jgi:3-deoxy-D-arabino-heptulosonate 7-phosphate (DAHP) synthase
MRKQLQKNLVIVLKHENIQKNSQNSRKIFRDILGHEKSK